MFVMEPPFGVSGCHIWGGYGGGRGSLCHVPQGRGSNMEGGGGMVK